MVNPQIIPGFYQPIAHLKDRHHGDSAEIRGFHTSALTTGFLEIFQHLKKVGYEMWDR